ncbi:MAG: hypothetical protein VX871_05705 [Pseudomonadota bacterium]|nr:hypothetical protein [Pseudomonadota bacterium]
MPDYGEILQFLARNPPQFASERQLHASLLELLANCLRVDDPEAAEGTGFQRPQEAARPAQHHHWVHFN